MDEPVKNGILKTWSCFVKGERFFTKGYEPVFYWGKIELFRSGWSENGVMKYSERYIVKLDWHREENVPKWVRNSAIYSNVGRYEDIKKDFNSLESAKSFIRRNITTSNRVYWKIDSE